MSDKSILLPEGYADWLNQLKTDISHTQQKAVQTVNQALVQLYLRIGQYYSNNSSKVGAQKSLSGWRVICVTLFRKCEAGHQATLNICDFLPNTVPTV